MPHIDEDGRCSWCGWEPDESYLQWVAHYRLGDYESAWREEWALHMRKHQHGLLPRPRELQAEHVLAEAWAILWLARDAR